MPFAVERHANTAGISDLQSLLNFLSRIPLADFKLHIGLVSYEADARLNFADRASSLREKIATVAHSAVFAANGKWLARRATRNQIDAPAPRLKILVVNVAFDERPMPHKLEAAPLVCADRFASVVIVFENGIVLEARV